MENKLRQILDSQRSTPNPRLAAVIARVEAKYAVTAAELDDEHLGWVSAAGVSYAPPLKEEDPDA